MKRGNIVYERCRFNLRCQEEGESAASFISDVYALAEHCGYGDLRDELIRDRLVVGIRDRRLSERLQLDADLTLDKAVTIIWQLETVHQQQVFLRGDNDETRQIPIDAVKTSKRPGKSMSDTGRGSGPSKQTMCSRCGKSLKHDIGVCPAKDAICKVWGHFQRARRSKKKISSINETPEPTDRSFFLGVVLDSKEPWSMTLWLNGRSTFFCV